MDALLTCVRADGTPSAEVGRVPVPVPASNELLIAVHAVALNPVDALYVAHPISRSLGRVVGSDIAGVVVAVGELAVQIFAETQARQFLIGMWVIALPHFFREVGEPLRDVADCSLLNE